MLKSIVNGAEHDIISIPMKGKNLLNENASSDADATHINYNKVTPVVLIAGQSYTFSCNMACNGLYIRSVSDDSNIASANNSRTLTYTPQVNVSVYFRIWNNSGITNLNPMFNSGSTALPYEPYGYQNGWEVRDNQNRLIWGREDELQTTTGTLPFKGYGLDIKEYSIDGNMVQAAEKEYSITDTSPLDFQSNGSNATISISGNETQASNQAYTTSGTSPLSFNADGTNLTALSMDGNMNQESTPSPSSPITPIECGVKTENLFDINGTWIKQANTDTISVSGDTVTITSKYYARMDITLNPNTDYTYQFYTTKSSGIMTAIYHDSTVAANAITVQSDGRLRKFNTGEYTNILFLFYSSNGSEATESYSDIMLVEGEYTQQTMPSYEPYGYKIPITVGSTTNNIFINQPIRKIGNYSDSIGSDGVVTRNIKKMVLDGTEDWVGNAKDDQREIYQVYNSIVDYPGTLVATNVVCSHLETRQSASLTSMYEGIAMRGLSSGIICGFSYGTVGIVSTDSYTSATNKVKAYLSNQYSAGTPVEVWYVLETPDTTETTTIPTISTVNGANTLTTGTPITPSNITISTSSSVYPKNPIYPEECGDRTDNLLDYRTVQNGPYATATVITNGISISGQYYVEFKSVDFEIGEAYSMSWISNATSGNPSIQWRLSYTDGTYSYAKISGTTITVEKTVKSLLIYISTSEMCSADVTNIMLNSGSTASTYEPFGYKIPVTIGSNTNYIYTKEPIRKICNYADVVNSDGSITRYIKKLVLTGAEQDYNKNNNQDTNYLYWFRLENTPSILIGSPECMCNYLRYVNYAPAATVAIGTSGNRIFYLNFGADIMTAQTSGNTIAGLREYISAQYSSGNPVTIWYILQTPTTEQTTIPTLTTVDGKNTATIGTTLAPSSITITATSKVYPNNPIIPEMCGVRTGNLLQDEQMQAVVENNGITFTRNSDGSITANGTATARAKYTYYGMAAWKYDYDTNYYLSGCPSGGGTSTYSILIDSTVMQFRDVGTGKSVNLPSGTGGSYNFEIRVESGVTVSNLIFKPMLNLGSTALPYEPYGWKVPFENHGENLWDENYTGISGSMKYVPLYVGDGDFTLSTTMPAHTAGTATQYTNLFLLPGNVSSGASTNANGAWLDHPHTVSASGGYVTLVFRRETNSPADYQTMLNPGSTPKPYSPYLNETIPVYLGEVPTVRRVRKLVLDGTEDIGLYSGLFYIKLPLDAKKEESIAVKSTHFYGMASAPLDNLCCRQMTTRYWGGRLAALQVRYDAITSPGLMANFLRVQYAAGHPVTIWYVLATEQTGIVNEPLAKISTYADELTTIGVHGLSAPLYGIRDYKDTLNLSTGVVTRKVKRLVLTGSESGITKNGSDVTNSLFYIRFASNSWPYAIMAPKAICTHLKYQAYVSESVYIGNNGTILYLNFGADVMNEQPSGNTVDGVKEYLAAQYQAGAPVTIWYVLTEPTTETVTVPTGMTGEIEGYLTQISTPTPTNRSVPKWNGKEETGGTYAVTVYTPPEIPTTTGKNTLTVDTTLAPYNVIVDGHIKYGYWGKIREDVRSGLAQTKFPVGTILYDNEDETTGRAFQVVGYDKHFDPSLTARGYTHSMTLCQLKLSGPWQYDAIEAFLYTTVEMQPGTYKFKIPNYDTTYGGNKTYYFTSTASVPVDSQIVLKWDYQKPPASVTAYAGPNPQTNTTAITGFNALQLSEWVEGESPEAIDLGTIKLANNDPDSAYGKLNHIHRARYGSNNYYQSGLRQLLNTDLAANNWWHPTIIFDRPYANRTTNGYLRSLNEDFINVLATPEITHISNNIFEYPSLDGRTFTKNTEYKINTDKIFLLSHTEVGLSSSPNIGTVLDYYSTHNTNADRIKYRLDNGNAYYWWFRTPYPSVALHFRYCDTSGALNNNGAFINLGVAPACIIQ